MSKSHKSEAGGLCKWWNRRSVWLHKTFDLRHGYGYHCQVFDLCMNNIGYGFSKNKFTSYRNAIKDLHS